MGENKFYEQFKEKVLEWFEYQDTVDQKDVIEMLMMHCNPNGEIDDNWMEDNTPYEVAEAYTGEQWYDYCHRCTNSRYNLDFTQTVTDILEEAAEDMENYDFFRSFIDIIVGEIDGYDNPETFFTDLKHGGCASYCVGGMVYNDELKKMYIEDIDSYDDFIMELEAECGGPIVKDSPRYVCVVWTCFEEFCYRIYNNLYED